MQRSAFCASILGFAGICALLAPAASAAPSFRPTGSMTSERFSHTATLLGDGTILFTGGNSSPTGVRKTAEIFDPATGSCRSLNPHIMTSARYGHTATVLPNGKVLITGGETDLYQYTNTAELFDPVTKTFSALPPMNSVRFQHTATLLQNGKVLIAGGGYPATNTAEIFDPASGTFTPLPSMASVRLEHTATLLPNGKVLIAGGTNGGTDITPSGLAAAELFDPVSGTFTSVSPMALTHYYHTATLLPNGKVLITGGITGNGEYSNAAEMFDPSSASFTPVSSTMSSPRYGHTATLLPNGKVLIAAGGVAAIVSTNTADLFDPATGTFTPLAPMAAVRGYHTAILLPDGRVLISGGFQPAGDTIVAIKGQGMSS